ncbi:MAG TPA: hypothetical protein VFZ61_16010 [Polyangiales bacterium]
MLSARPSGPYTVVVDHQSSHGPEVTHIRGILLVKSLENLRKAELFERYAAELSDTLRNQIEGTMATSWVPVELAEEHYAACDRLALNEPTIERLGALMAESMDSSVMSTLLKTTRQAGVESMWSALKQTDRLWDRLYQGGKTTLLQLGPKDLILEHHGISLAKSRHFRAGLRAYWVALGQMMTKVVYVKLIRPRVPHPHSIALAGSWV